jgi:hypothetical protein
MMSPDLMWPVSSDVQALLDRALTYRREVYARTGVPPESFLVTPDELSVLRRQNPYGVHELMTIAGMTVSLQARPLEWNRPGGAHLSWHVGVDMAAHDSVSRSVIIGVDMDIHDDDPLPPLDDLDEGLQCCARSYPTFATYLTHRRQAHELET